MMKFHANILKKNGEKEFVVIPYEEFVKIQEQLEDYECLKALREAKAKEADADTASFNQVKKELNLEQMQDVQDSTVLTRTHQDALQPIANVFSLAFSDNPDHDKACISCNWSLRRRPGELFVMRKPYKQQLDEDIPDGRNHIGEQNAAPEDSCAVTFGTELLHFCNYGAELLERP